MWWAGNQSITSEQFDTLYKDFLKHAEGMTLFAQDLYGGADPSFRLQTRVFGELAWHALFIRTLLISPEAAELSGFVPELTIIDLPSFKADPKRHGVRSENVVAIDFARKIVLIGGSYYAGEMKKSVFTTLNYYLPEKGVMPMHCSANVGPDGDTAVFFGLSGTGKTTLSADPKRTLIGDDEHGWGADGVFNFEGGCYAKCIKLSKEAAAGVLDLLRLPVPAARPFRVRQFAARPDRQTRRRLLAGQHRLARRQIRHRPPHADQGDAGAVDRGAERLAAQCRFPHRQVFRLRGTDLAARRRAAYPRSDQDLGRQGRIRQDRARAGWHVPEEFCQVRSAGGRRRPRRRAGSQARGGIAQRHSGARASANPESQCNNFWIPGSLVFTRAPE